MKVTGECTRSASERSKGGNTLAPHSWGDEGTVGRTRMVCGRREVGFVRTPYTKGGSGLVGKQAGLVRTKSARGHV